MLVSRMAHCMIRVRDLDRSIHFYRDLLGLDLRARHDFPEGRYTLAFLGAPDSAMELELTQNWDGRPYEHGTFFGHLAFSVGDVRQAAAALAEHGVPVLRPAGPRQDQPDEVIAFVSDPDGYPIELVSHEGRRGAGTTAVRASAAAGH